jgi:hypothetical protein
VVETFLQTSWGLAVGDFVHLARLVLYPSPIRVKTRMKLMNNSNKIENAPVEVSLDELHEITGGQQITCKLVTLSPGGNNTTIAKCD